MTELLSRLSNEEVSAEICEVITRPKLQAKYSRLTIERAEKFVEILRTKATFIKGVPSVFNYRRDPKDEKYINLAATGVAAYLISSDADLLNLMTGFDEESKNSHQKFRPLKVIEPLELLKIVEEKTKGNLVLKP